ncbi:F-box/LRR-repeat protein [Thalictrum thalictroides]|uniref:F-box/LRR-repeat protein n=1 Tax=Thalictrum thalictroides TaxID=46969 RepID=A0A7J6WRN4_THATH|nr:F-box/LRR-repeat protein [Thalictrum thalictroides]
MFFYSMVKKKVIRPQEDRITSLPNAILHEILSYLDMKQVVQMSILSKGWKNLWKSLPIVNFDDQLWEDKIKFRNFLEQVLLTQEGLNLKKFSLASVYHDGKRLERWLDAAVRRCGVMEVHLKSMVIPTVKSICILSKVSTLHLIDVWLPNSDLKLLNVQTLVVSRVKYKSITISAPQLMYIRLEDMRDVVNLCAPQLTSLQLIRSLDLFLDYFPPTQIHTEISGMKNLFVGGYLHGIIGAIDNAESMTMSGRDYLESGLIFTQKYFTLTKLNENCYTQAWTSILKKFDCLRNVFLKGNERTPSNEREEWAAQLSFEHNLFQRQDFSRIKEISGSENYLGILEYLAEDTSPSKYLNLELVKTLPVDLKSTDTQ